MTWRSGIFSSLEYESLKRKPAFPVNGLLWLLGLCMVMWAGLSGVSAYMLIQGLEMHLCRP